MVDSAQPSTRTLSVSILMTGPCASPDVGYTHFLLEPSVITSARRQSPDYQSTRCVQRDHAKLPQFQPR